MIENSIQVGKYKIENRAVCQPMEGCDCNTDGSPGELTVKKYLKAARSGAGTVWFEANAVCPEGRTNPRQMMLTRENLPQFKTLLRDMRKISERECGIRQTFILQLTHSGRQSITPMIAYRHPIYEEKRPVTDANIVSDEYLDTLPEKYVASARLAIEAGFDGVDVKSCHGYLFQELLSAFLRKGRYGGSFKNRARLYLDCVRAVKEAIPDNILLTTRLSVSDMVQKPYGFGTTEQNELDLDEPDILIERLVSEGVQMLNVTVGNPYYNPHVNRPYRKGGYEPPEAAQDGLARFEYIEKHIKEKFPTLTVVGSGLSYYRDDLIEQSERQLQNGICDLVGYGRMWLAYPMFYRDYLNGAFDSKKCCLACSKCTELMRAKQVSGCAVFNEYYRELYKTIKNDLEAFMFLSFLKNHDLSEYSFSSELFPAVDDRNFWDNFQNDTCVDLAEAEIDYTWPIIKATDFMEFKKSGNRVIMEKIHFDRRNHLVLFALAELKENKGRFIPAIVNGLFTVCEESFWGLSAHYLMTVENIPSPEHPYIDLFAAETAEHLAMIVTLLRRPLLGFCPEIVDRVEYELDRRVKTPYESRYDFGWMGYKGKRVNNWNPWILSNVLTVFLLTECNQRRKQKAIEKMLSEIQHYYDSMPEDGGCDEGPGYWHRAGASLFEFLYQLKCATSGEMNFFGDAKIGRIADYLKKVHITADVFANVADAHAEGKGNLALLLYGFAKETNQKELMNFSAAVYRDRTVTSNPLDHTNRTLRRIIYSSVYLCEIETLEPTYPLHGALEYLPDLELAVLRKGNFILSAKGGFNKESHNHNDVGSFTLYDGATPILVDIGISTYTRFTFDSSTRYSMIPWTRGSYHNIPMINEKEQPVGEEYRADSFAADESGINISFPRAYPSDAQINGLDRSLELTDSALIVTDRFDFADGEKQSVCEVLMSVLPTSVENNAVTVNGRYRISSNAGTFRCERIPFEDASLERDWNTDACFRLMLECDGEKEICIKVEKI